MLKSTIRSGKMNCWQLLLMVLSTPFLAYSQEHTFSWLYVVDGYNSVYLADVAVDSNGNTFAAFNYTSNLTLPVLNQKLPYAPHVHGLIMKFDSLGKPLWAHSFVSKFDNRIKDIAIAPNGDVLLTGFGDGVMEFPSRGGDTQRRGIPKEKGQYHNNQGIFVARYAPDGRCKWVNYFNTPWGEGLSLALNRKDEVYLAYYFKGKLMYDGQVIDSIPRNQKLESREGILVMNGDGSIMSNHPVNQVVSSSYINRIGLQVDHDDNLILFGTFRGRIDLTANDSLVNDASQESLDSYIAKFDKNFRLLWARKIGGRNHQVIAALELDADNNLYASGWYYFECIIGSMVEVFEQSNYEWKSGDSFFYLKMDQDGNLAFSRFENNKGYDSYFGARSMTLDGNGDAHIIAHFNDTLKVENRKLETWHHNHQLAYMRFEQNTLEQFDMPFEASKGWMLPISIAANQFQLALGAEYYGEDSWAMIHGKRKILSFNDYGRVAFVCGGKIKPKSREEQDVKKDHFDKIQPLLACVKPEEEVAPDLWFPAENGTDSLHAFIAEQPCGTAIKDMQAILYPNPTKGGLTLSLSGLSEGMQMEIFSESGQLLFSQRLEAMDQAHDLKLNVANLASGNYFLRLAGIKYQKVLRFLKIS